MKNTLLLFVLAIGMSLSGFAVQHQPDSTRTDVYNTVSSTWTNLFRYHYRWDTRCKNRLEYHGFNWNNVNSAWDSSGSYYFSYDAQDNVTDAVYRYGVPVLEPFTKQHNTYNGSQLQSYTVQYWKPYLAAYRNEYLYTCHYNGIAKMDTTWTQTWDTVANTWKAYSRDVYQYDAAGDDTGFVYQTYNSSSMTYENTSRYSYTYTATHKQASSIYYYWNTGAGAWIPTSRAYSTYDVSDQLSQTRSQNYSPGTNTWNDYNKTDYTVNTDGDITYGIYYRWLSNTWSPQYSYYYYYGCAISTGIEEAAADQVQLFPNPASGSIQLSLPSLNAPTTLSIMNIQGQQLSQQPVTRGMNTINLSDLAPGMYLLQWLDGGQLRTKQFIKE